VGLFTDNQQDYVWELGTSTTGGGGGNGAYESIRFSLPGVDFSDDTITSIVTTVTSHIFVAPNNYDVYDFQVQVNGTEGTGTGGSGTSTAPEPSTWLLMLTGPAAIALFRRLARSS
ncbi:MAG TPA: PEP-CTERM sorting domain-containing protein, partial [Bryobacteraceae bacterium]|nr:PEP-CTERM sorting domain-containing protein [Bryobacteraceae bacterium]